MCDQEGNKLRRHVVKPGVDHSNIIQNWPHGIGEDFSGRRIFVESGIINRALVDGAEFVHVTQNKNLKTL